MIDSKSCTDVTVSERQPNFCNILNILVSATALGESRTSHEALSVSILSPDAIPMPIDADRRLPDFHIFFVSTCSSLALSAVASLALCSDGFLHR